jgi:trimeric autotransporter adhesin
VAGAVSDVARGTNGTLRANYLGESISLADPTIDRFFNTNAFTVPASGAFGNASRNMIIGPGSRLLNAQFARDVRLSSTRVLGVQLNANNLLNLVNYGAIDTVVNSPTFGQILSVRGMRSMQLNLRFRF